MCGMFVITVETGHVKCCVYDQKVIICSTPQFLKTARLNVIAEAFWSWILSLLFGRCTVVVLLWVGGSVLTANQAMFCQSLVRLKVLMMSFDSKNL